jgi:hypothetical protein
MHGARSVLWFVGLWIAGVASLGFVAALLHELLRAI